MGDITYKEAAVEDSFLIAKLKGEVWNTIYRGIYSDSKLDNYDIERDKSTFEKIIFNPNMDLSVAISGEKIVGFMSCGEPYIPYLHYKQEIGLLVYFERIPKRGIGKAFFLIAKDIIKNNGYDEFFISVNKYYTNALGFYIAMGGSIINIDEDKENKPEAQIKLHFTV